MGLLIRGGEVVTASGRRRADVWCEGETITKVAAGIEPPPGASLRSKTAVLKPLRAISRAATSADGPPPTKATSIFR